MLSILLPHYSVKSSSILHQLSLLTALAAVLVAGFLFVEARSGSAQNAPLFITVGDGKDVVAPGGSLVYIIRLQQNYSYNRDVNVTFSIPPAANTISADNGGYRVGNTIRWDHVTVQDGYPMFLAVNVNLLPNLTQGTQIFARVEAEGSSATDVTAVGSAPFTNNTYRVSITDGMETARPGETLDYTVTVLNTSEYARKTDVSVSLSDLLGIQSMDPEGSINTYPSTTWPSITFGPGEKKLFHIQTMIRRHLTPYTYVHAMARVGGVSASDNTNIVPWYPYENRFTTEKPTLVLEDSATEQEPGQPIRKILFRKVADTNEVVPGGTVHYTVYVQNVLAHDITDAVVTDRFDPSQMSVVSAAGGDLSSDGQITWNLPVLRPGEVWKRTYTMVISSDLQSGSIIDNAASISGSDLRYLSLNERVTVGQAGVVGELPSTGAAYDALFVLLGAVGSIGLAGMQKKIAA